jgi:hypothetical protein
MDQGVITTFFLAVTEHLVLEGNRRDRLISVDSHEMVDNVRFIGIAIGTLLMLLEFAIDIKLDVGARTSLLMNRYPGTCSVLPPLNRFVVDLKLAYGFGTSRILTSELPD